MQARVKKLENLHTKSVEKLGAALDEIIRLKTEEEALLIVKKIVADAFVRIVNRTPVDTGRARASWQFGVGIPPAGEAPEGEYPALKVDGKAAIRAAVSDQLDKISDASPAALWYIANHLDYIEALEAGHSLQSKPYAMLNLTLRELNHQLRKKYEL